MDTKGLVLINTGNGKGKTTAALGTAIRAWGAGQRVLFLQFIKGSRKYGELESIHVLGEVNGHIEIRSMGDGFVFHSKENNAQEYERKKKLAQNAWNEAVREIMSNTWDLVVLDEVNYAIHFGLLSEDDVISMIKNRPARLNLILTGRYAPKKLIEIADTVTEMCPVKHAFEKGIMARRGIEF